MLALAILLGKLDISSSYEGYWTYKSVGVLVLVLERGQHIIV